MPTPTRGRRTGLGLAAALLVACAPAVAPEPSVPGEPMQIGQPAPDFAVQDETGTVRKLADFRGKTLVLWFYPKADTPG